MVAKKKKISKKRTISRESLDSAAPIKSPDASSAPPSGSPISGLLLKLIAVAVVLYLAYAVLHSNGNNASPAAASHPAWGPETKLTLVSKFDIPDEVRSIRADEDGNVYLLTLSGIERYTNGKRSAAFPVALESGDGNMDFDGQFFYETAHNKKILRIAKDFSHIEHTYKIDSAKELFGIAATPKGPIYVSDLSQHSVRKINLNGKFLGYIGSTSGDGGAFFRVVDLALASDGSLFTHDHMAKRINRFNPDGKLVGSWEAPWTGVQCERLCVLNGYLYVNGFTDKRLFIEDSNGKAVGECEKLSDGTPMDNALLVGAGMDGFLYVKNGGTVYKLKPLVPVADTASTPSTK
jgi:hypothetical protein